MDQKEKVELFRALHQQDEVFLLPNCWDVISARTLKSCGFPAIATASASIAWSYGVGDGEKLACDEMLAVIARICGGVDMPVSADIERGYGQTSDDVAQTVAGVIKAGAVGFNIEDSMADGGQRGIEDMQTRIRAARAVCDRSGIDMYINARADGYLLGKKGQEVFDETVVRGKAWLAAGADCVFVPGVGDINIIKNLANAIAGPISVIVIDENTATLKELTSASVCRISTGPRTLQFVTGTLQTAMKQLREDGDFAFMKKALSFADVQNFS